MGPGGIRQERFHFCPDHEKGSTMKSEFVAQHNDRKPSQVVGIAESKLTPLHSHSLYCVED
jgi:hypothetical protein